MVFSGFLHQDIIEILLKVALSTITPYIMYNSYVNKGTISNKCSLLLEKSMYTSINADKQLCTVIFQSNKTVELQLTN